MEKIQKWTDYDTDYVLIRNILYYILVILVIIKYGIVISICGAPLEMYLFHRHRIENM